MMLYTVGDRFLVRGLETKVVYVNADLAWVAPLEDGMFENQWHYSNCALDVLDEKGIDSKGNSAISIPSKDCQAV